MEQFAKPINCSLCNKSFPSMKSLYGHMRSHPDRVWRGVQPPPPLRRHDESGSAATSLSPPTPIVTGKRGRRSTVVDPELEACIQEGAFYLMKLAYGNCKEFVELNKKEEKKKNPRKDTDDIPNSYICDLCNTSFPTPQALGGHRSSHNKSKNLQIMKMSESKTETVAVSVADDVNMKVISRASGHHQCNICEKTFPTGQALGGHMRRHWTPNNAEAHQSAQANSPKDFDLNQLPAIDAENSSPHELSASASPSHNTVD